MNKKIILYIIVGAAVIGGLGWGGWQLYVDQRAQESKDEVAQLPDRSISALDEDDIVRLDDEEVDLIEDTTATLQPSDSTTQQTNDDQDIVVDELPQLQPAPEGEPITTSPRSVAEYSWSGIANYRTSGSAKVIDTNGTYSLQFGSDFSFSGAPDPVVYLCPEKSPGNINDCTLIGGLENNSGASAWAITEDEFSANPYPILWCRAFSVLMATVN